MNAFDRYRSRVKRRGDNNGDAIFNTTKAFAEAHFHESPTYQVVEVQSTEFPTIKEQGVRIIEVERLGTVREVIFKYGEALGVGTYLKFEKSYWMIYDLYSGTISPKGIIARCNDSIKWKDDSGHVMTYPCVAQASDLGSKSKQGKNEIEWNKYDVRLPVGQLFIYVEANETTRTIGINDRLMFGSRIYTIGGLDDSTMVNDEGFGVIQFTGKLSPSRDTDDFNEEIADNNTGKDYDNSEGGMLW